ncbi:ATP-binding protein [Paraburkholderia dinghuensis]|uniref:histidine kinase n=1 Tax=Paraburkholderia dinghuensis TaxID=2305225 RepID=A0A3N6MYQ3_9BURK|nr:ATP-binding protein [Paraburkholderia dinghuensis]RQH07155.1 two-component sensor histidine kinase [Paraburkholderia dinghuensis]
MPRSLQARMAVLLAAGLIVFSLAAAFAVFHVLRGEIDRMSDSALQETAQRLVPLAVMDIVDVERQPGDEQRIAAVRAHHELLTYIVRDQAGNMILQSHDANPAIFPPGLTSGFRSTPTHRIYAETVLQGTVTLLIAEPLVSRQRAGLVAAFAVLRPLLLLVPLGLLGTWLMVRSGLRPIRRFCEGIGGRGRDDLSPLSKAGLPAEIEPVADSVNELMNRLGRALTAERSFTANSAHELRTPIAAALAQTQRLIAEAQGSQLEERARTVETSLRTLARLSEKLMQLARAEGAHILADVPQDLRPVLRIVVEDIRRADQSNRIFLTLPEQEVDSRIDPDAFAILVRNLIENAIRHGESEVVRVVLSADGRLSVANRGPVVPVDTLARLTEPFERGATAATGSGLGLAIVNAIAQAAGARLHLNSPASGCPDGFEAVVEGLTPARI